MKRLMMVSGALAVLALVLAVWLLIDRPKPRTPEEVWKPQALIENDSAIDEISIVTGGKSFQLVFKQDYEAFFMTIDGKEYFPDQIMTDRIVDAILGLEKTKLIALDPEDVTIYGLNPPAMTLSVKFDGGQAPLELEVGKENYSHDALFARLKGEPTVFLIPLDMTNFVGMEAASYRTRTLFYTQPQNVASIEVKINDPALKAKFPQALEPKLVVQKQAGGQQPIWIVVSPVNEPAVFPVVDSFFSRLRIPNAENTIDPQPGDLAKMGLENPRATVTLTLFSGEQEQIKFGNIEGHLIYATNSIRPEVLQVPLDLLVDVLNFSGRFGSPLIEQREILANQVIIEYPREGLPTMELQLQPDNKTYAVVGQPDQSVTLARLRRVTRFLRNNNPITIVEQREPYDRAKYGLDKPRMHIRLMEGNNVALDFSFGSTVSIEGKDFTFGEDLKRKCVVAIDGDAVSQIPYGEREFTAPLKVRSQP